MRTTGNLYLAFSIYSCLCPKLDTIRTIIELKTCAVQYVVPEHNLDSNWTIITPFIPNDQLYAE